MNTKPDKDAEEKRSFTHGSSGATADAAVEGRPDLKEDRSIEAPSARSAKPLNKGEKPDQLADKAEETRNRQEALVDESIEESFPASDPPSAKKIT